MLKKGAVILLIAAALFISLWGCAAEQGMECAAPLSLIGERCCLDEDSNSVCDVDEAVVAEEVTVSEEKEITPSGSYKEGPSEQKTIVSEEETEEEKAAEGEEAEEQAASQATQEGAEAAGKKFAATFSSKQYAVLYTMFTPAVQKEKTADEFKAIMELDPFYKKLTEVQYKGIAKIDDETYELTLLAKTNVQEIDIPEVKLRFVDGQWKVRAFVDVFELSTFDAACSGYRYSNAYKTSDCAFDLAKKVKGAEYCDLSECHYVECRKALGATAGMTQEAEQCKLCQPPMKTVNDCILDVAIKYDKVAACNVIDDKHYSDKYCACYGGFAKHKGTPGYCNMVQNEDYKHACMKGYEGKYC
ncbi:hypothetical protein KY362_07340 [Candidatus Woesearchaeota archaeon]|nr:hypothetical protein [Candidatus Woesearchaeota archaeon]